MKAHLLINSVGGKSSIRLDRKTVYIFQERGIIQVDLAAKNTVLAEIRDYEQKHVFVTVQRGICPTFRDHKFRLKKLNDGDEIRLGSTIFTYLCDDKTRPLEETSITPTATLKILSGPCKGKKLVLDGSRVHLGRDLVDETSGFILDDQFISQVHCRIEYRGGAYVITDLHSKNGTLVNGETIQERSLRHGDLISVGTTVIRFTSKSLHGLLTAVSSSKALTILLAVLIIIGFLIIVIGLW